MYCGDRTAFLGFNILIILLACPANWPSFWKASTIVVRAAGSHDHFAVPRVSTRSGK
jgi:hypothetical protein